MTETLRPGGLLSGQIFELDDQFVRYRNAYGKSFSVPRSQVETVVVDAKGWGKSVLKLIGRGTVLASVEMPTPWCAEVQRWLLTKLGL